MALPIVISREDSTMTYRFSKFTDHLILLVAALFLAITVVWALDRLDISYPWETPLVAPAPEFRSELRAYG